MNKSKVILVIIVLGISAAMTFMTMYVFGKWQHNRYWNGTIARVNQIESSVYDKLLKININEIYLNKDFNILRDVFEPLNGKLLIRLINYDGKIIFENLNKERQLGTILRQSIVDIGPDKLEIQIISYRPPPWRSEYFGWLTHFQKWFSIKYDRITIPFIFFFFIWSLSFVAVIWRYKAHLENDRLFNVLSEFETNKDEKELE